MTEFGMRSFTVQGQRKNSKLYVHPEGPYRIYQNEELQYGKFLMEKNALRRTKGGAMHIYTHCYTYRKKCPARAIFTEDNVVVKNGGEPHNHLPVEDEVDQFRLLMELRNAERICKGNQEIVFNCELCEKVFSHKKTLMGHYRAAHQVEPSSPDCAHQNFKCVHCDNAVFVTLTRLRSHYVYTHQFDPVTQHLEFDTLSAFEIWRRAVENESGLRLRRRWGSRRRKDGSIRLRFSCVRNDPLNKGVVRVNFAWCPAEMKVVKKGGPNGKVLVEWNSSHYGHDLDHLTIVAVQDSEAGEAVTATLENYEDAVDHDNNDEEQPMGVNEAKHEEQSEGLVSEMQQIISEEGVGAEDSALLLQEGSHAAAAAASAADDETVNASESLAQEVSEQNEMIVEDAACESTPTLEPSLRRAVSSMGASVGLTKMAVRQGGTLRGSQQVEAVSKMNDLLQLMVNVQLEADDYDQVHRLMDAILIVYKKRLQRQQSEAEALHSSQTEDEHLITLDAPEGHSIIVLEDPDNVQHLYADHSYSTQDGETVEEGETTTQVTEGIVDGVNVQWEVQRVECIQDEHGCYTGPAETLIVQE